MNPQDIVARQYMADKGYTTPPRDITALDGHPCWYYVYDLPEGVLELEVSWNGTQWSTEVVTFNLA